MPFLLTDKCGTDIHLPAVILSLTPCPPAPPVGAIRLALAAVTASGTVRGAGPCAQAPFLPPQPSPHGFATLQAWDPIPGVIPAISGPGGSPRIPASSISSVNDGHSSKLLLSKQPMVFLTGNSPLGAACDNTARVSNPPLVKHSFDVGSVSSGEIIKQTSPTAAAAIKPVRADGNDTSDLGLNADLSSLVLVITETIVPLTHTVPLALKQFALSTANGQGAIESAGVDLG